MHKLFNTFILTILMLLYTSVTFAAEVKRLIPPSDFQAFDTPNDNGKSISLRWPSSPSESADVEYVVYASTLKSVPFDTEVLRISATTMYEENSDSNFHYAEINLDKFFGEESIGKRKDKNYFFKLVLMSGNNTVVAEKIASASPKGNWFNWLKLNNFIIMILFCGLVLYLIEHAKKNPNLYLRKISGLDAIEEALGRAT
ncbi:MAG: DUF6754 domain-containing protein, partial [Candidatus Scalindua sp.]